MTFHGNALFDEMSQNCNAEQNVNNGIIGFLMKANTPPKAEKYSVIIE